MGKMVGAEAKEGEAHSGKTDDLRFKEMGWKKSEGCLASFFPFGQTEESGVKIRPLLPEVSHGERMW